MIVRHFGIEKVAEATGRSQRVVDKTNDHGNTQRVVERWSKTKGLADMPTLWGIKSTSSFFLMRREPEGVSTLTRQRRTSGCATTTYCNLDGGQTRPFRV